MRYTQQMLQERQTAKSYENNRPEEERTPGAQAPIADSLRQQGQVPTQAPIADSLRQQGQVPTQALQQSAAVSSPIEQDMAEGMLRIHYQPIVDLETGAVFAQEALGRTASDRFDGPVGMFENALEVGCVGELGRALRHMAVQHSPALPLFVNVHPKEFDEGWLVRPDEAIFWHNEAVYLEITESMPLSHFALCQSVLRELRGKGVFLAVDDLGAGYSNLKYIADLAPDVVKLDRVLIAGLTGDTRQFRLVKHLVRLCTEMGARVVAEGIETKDELHAVIDAGAHYGQGFFLARPAFPAPAAYMPPK
jgi:EAL domain-containing protein (putative c-di-GMP-specific phosphodiesterase class I)